ncbi:hypothetical protein BDN70DRAFT_603555 [Pholiota conissans]|uniref:F-box domain-containing protein n=1 Tax=Pholiota conissans TaxID=109636 RepID=A0A9P5Z6Z9_9AGAR|nr:hypothetical protein BDN70DRAFT_603555 [Pholiota conissans]
MMTALYQASDLPPETWVQVLDKVPQDELPKLLNVRSMFHNIVIWPIFSTMRLYFLGDWIARECYHIEDAKYTVCRSCQEAHCRCVHRWMGICATSDVLPPFVNAQSRNLSLDR